MTAAIWTGCELLGDSTVGLSDRPITTTQEEYVATVRSDSVLLVDLPFVFKNDGSQSYFVKACGEAHPPTLEKKVGGTWTTAYVPRRPECLSPPLVLAPGRSHRDTLAVEAWLQKDVRQRFWPEEISGTYRLVWQVYREKEDHDERSLLPLEKRTSNSFSMTGGRERSG